MRTARGTSTVPEGQALKPERVPTVSPHTAEDVIPSVSKPRPRGTRSIARHAAPMPPVDSRPISATVGPEPRAANPELVAPPPLPLASGTGGTAARAIAAPVMDKSIPSGVLHRAGALFLRFLLGFILSQARVFGIYAPFGVGYVAAGGTGVAGWFGLLGTLSGYMFLWEIYDGLKYMAIGILIFAALILFQHTLLSQRSYFVPLSTFIAASFIGIVFVAGEGFETTRTLLFAAELILMSGSAYFFHIALHRNLTKEENMPTQYSVRRLISLFILLACLLLSVANVTLFGGLSVARFSAILVVMLLSYRSGMGLGSAAGLTMGLALDLSGGTPFFSMAFGLSGLMGGTFSGAGKLACAAVYVLTSGVTVLWMPDSALRLNILLETFCASVVFMLLPERSLPYLPFAATSGSAAMTRARRMRERAGVKLGASAEILKELYASLLSTFSQLSKKGDNEIAMVFDRTSDRVCKTCALLNACWDRDAHTTYHALKNAATVMLKTGRLEAGDFSDAFCGRCLHFQKFVSVANEELTALLYRKQFQSRLRESRLLLCHQYAEIAKLMQQISAELQESLTFDPKAEAQVSKSLHAQGLVAHVSVYRNSHKRLHVEIEAENLALLQEDMPSCVRTLSKLLRVPLIEGKLETGDFGQRLTFREQEPYLGIVGVAVKQKNGQSVSGDTAAYFKSDDDKLYVILSDGMGSGQNAAFVSTRSVALLRHFLEAGIAPDSALRTLNSTLVLRGAESTGFTTVDLLQFDLLTGETVFYKFGASPSYIKQGRKVSRITNLSLPAGLDTGGLLRPLDVTKIKLSPGALVVLTTDGVVDAREDEWLQKVLLEDPGASPKDLSAQLLKTALRRHGDRDDMMVLALRIEKTVPAFHVEEDIEAYEEELTLQAKSMV